MKAEYITKTVIQEARLRVETLADLKIMVDQKRALYCPSFPPYNTPRPAAFVYNYSACVVASLISRGLYIYEPKPKRKKAPKNPAAKRTTSKSNKIPPPQYDPRSVSFDALERVVSACDELYISQRLETAKSNFEGGYLAGIRFSVEKVRNAINTTAMKVDKK